MPLPVFGSIKGSHGSGFRRDDVSRSPRRDERVLPVAQGAECTAQQKVARAVRTGYRRSDAA